MKSDLKEIEDINTQIELLQGSQADLMDKFRDNHSPFTKGCRMMIPKAAYTHKGKSCEITGSRLESGWDGWRWRITALVVKKDGKTGEQRVSWTEKL